MAMQRIVPTQFTSLLWKIKAAQPQLQRQPPACDVFINHMGPDTKRTVAGLLYDRLVHLKLRPFLDAGDKDELLPSLAIQNCKVGVSILSPRFCNSRFCLEELALLVEAGKKIIPIFYDIQPSDLLKMSNAGATPEEMSRYEKALKEVRYTIGIVFDSQNESWADLLSKVSDMVLRSLDE